MSKIKLNPKIFNKDVEQIPIRKGFGEGLLIAGEKYPNIVGLCCDLTESTFMHLFKEKFPDRFVEIGIAEQNMASVASGLSAMGKLPFISSYAMFSPGRNWEQIRTTICYNDRPVIIVGSHAGLSVGPDGGTHQALEDIAITRVIPNMVVVSPSDAIEAKKAVLELAKMAKPAYLRLAREKTPVITTEQTPFEIGKANVFFGDENADVTIIATGSVVYKSIITAESLREDGINVNVINLHTIKPLDTETILSVVKKTNAVVTVEEHQIFGGMGSAVCEFLSSNYPVPVEMIGVRDSFGQSGKPEELLSHYGIDESSIEKAVTKVLKRKN
jgi:transketolase